MKALALVLAFLIGGCATFTPIAPETPTERYVLADAAFKVFLLSVKDAAVAGLITVEHAPRIKAAIIVAKTALDVWAVAPDNLNSEIAALLGLKAARELLLALTAGDLVLFEKTIIHFTLYHPIEYGAVS